MTFQEIQSKLDILRDNLEKLGQIPQSNYQEFLADFRNLDSALHRLQTSIQALTDFGSYLIARLGLAAPRSSREILERLEEAGLLPRGSAERFGPILGFRNRVVHLYDRVDPEIVYRILKDDRHELEELFSLLLDVAGKAPPQRL